MREVFRAEEAFEDLSLVLPRNAWSSIATLSDQHSPIFPSAIRAVPPEKLYLSALSSRLLVICMSRVRSPQI